MHCAREKRNQLALKSKHGVGSSEETRRQESILWPRTDKKIDSWNVDNIHRQLAANTTPKYFNTKLYATKVRTQKHSQFKIQHLLETKFLTRHLNLSGQLSFHNFRMSNKWVSHLRTHCAIKQKAPQKFTSYSSTSYPYPRPLKLEQVPYQWTVQQFLKTIQRIYCNGHSYCAGRVEIPGN